jgi:multiple sugar transport system permease protein
MAVTLAGGTGARKPASRRRSVWLKEETLVGYLFVAPIVVVLLLLVAYPFFKAFQLSLTDKMIGFPDPSFVGLDNYTNLLKDPKYWQTLGNTVIFTVASVGIKMPIGMGIALLMNQKIRARSIMRGIVLLPYAMPALTAVLIFSWFYNDQFGVFNYVLMQLGVISEPKAWLGMTSTALPAVTAVNIWKGFPFFVMTLLAGLQGISADLYEAANMDGASAIQRFWNITVPGVWPVLMITTLLSTIWTFNDFMIIYILTKGGPAYSTMVLSVMTYETAFSSFELGRGTAIPVTIMPILGVLVVLLTRAMSRQEANQ